MKIKIKMELISDVIFGNGESIPGEEDTSVLTDVMGFPYYKGGTFKGVLREEFERIIGWKNADKKKVDELFGKSGSDTDSVLTFSDFCLSEGVKSVMLAEIGTGNPHMIKEVLTNTRTFTSLNEDGVVKPGSLRIARCVNKGLVFYSEIDGEIDSNTAADLKEAISMVKWIGTKRNRGFGEVKISVIEEV